MATNLARTSGTREANCAMGVGPRISQHRLHLVSNQTRIINAQPIGGAASAAVTTFTALTLAHQANPYCGTLVAHIAQASPVAGTIQLRIKGFDQFGQDVSTTTPVVTLAAKTNNYVYLAHTLSYVTSVEFVSTGLDIAGDTVSLGQRWDWTRTIDGTNEHLHGRNLGIAIPMRLARRTTGSGAGRKFDPPLPAHMPHFGMNSGNNQAKFTQEWFQSNQGYAKALGIFGVNPANGETVTIGSVVYTFNTILGGANSILIGVDAATSAFNLRSAISAAPGSGEGTIYGAGTEPHPDVVGSTANIVGEFIPIVARDPGARGNLIALATTTAGLWYSALGHMEAGFDLPLEVTNIQVVDHTGLGSAGGVIVLGANKFAVGDNDVGWEGPVEKIHLMFAADVATWAVADNVFVDLTVKSLETANE